MNEPASPYYPAPASMPLGERWRPGGALAVTWIGLLMALGAVVLGVMIGSQPVTGPDSWSTAFAAILLAPGAMAIPACSWFLIAGGRAAFTVTVFFLVPLTLALLLTASTIVPF